MYRLAVAIGRMKPMSIVRYNHCNIGVVAEVTAMDFGPIKARMRAVWMAGDFGRIAEYGAKGAAEFVERLAIQPGMDVLDVACGTGNLAVPAARPGAPVPGVDLAANLLD